MHAEDIEIRSEEVQEILGTPPKWLTRWGTLLALVFFVVLGWIGYFVKYPDVVKAEVRVTSTDPIRVLRAPQGGIITQLRVSNEDTVEAGEVLVVLNANAKVEDVLTLENAVAAVGLPNEEKLLSFNPSKDLLLGSLKDNLYQFFKKQENLILEKSRKNEKLDVSQLRQRIRIAERTIESAKRSREKFEKEVLLARDEYTRLDNLFQTGLSTLDEVKKAKEKVYEKERGLEKANSEIKINEDMIDLYRKEMKGVQRSSSVNETSAYSDLNDEFIRLQKAIEAWKASNLVVSPITGIVVITDEELRDNTAITREQELMRVMPRVIKDNIGRISLNPYGSGKVLVGQKVIIKLNSYPFEEFGALTGEVAWKGKIPVENSIPIEVAFPDGLITNTGYQIEHGQEMLGTAEIITDKKRLIEWIFENFKRVTS
ncbi:MAG: hypothetical protein R2824_06630 [Saprospiraceae bacterium]|nr:hypothetical protein [Lewinella sp.]